MKPKMPEPHQFNRTENAILGYLVRNMTKEFSIKAIADGIKKSYPVVHRNMKTLQKKGIVRVKAINKTQTLCSIDNSKAGNVSVIATAEFRIRDAFLADKPQLKAILDDVLSRVGGNSYSFLLFGSHARGEAKPSSDVDMLFLANAMDDQKGMLSAAEGAGRLTNREIHPVVMTYRAFFGALREKQQNLPKEVLEKHIIIYGAESFHMGLVMNA